MDPAAYKKRPSRAQCPPMKIASIVCRILLGLLFGLAGLSGVYFLSHTPPQLPPGLARDFQDVFFASHWVQFGDASGSIHCRLRYCW